MPDLLEHMYCAQQINIPPNLPFILKQYAKAAIRTQPYDLLFWSAAYFRAKAENLPPPVKERLEYPPFESTSRLSPGFLRVLHKQLGGSESIRVEVLYEKWLGVCLLKEPLDTMLKIGSIHERVQWLKFVAIAAGHICPSLSKTMVLICEVLTDQPDGGAAWIDVEKFVELYTYLAQLDCGPEPPSTKKASVVAEIQSESSTEETFSYGEIDTEEPDFKEKLKEVSERDSKAGLMVWPDIQPPVKPDRVRTPKYSDQLGASSELGLEVLDDARGPSVKLVTLYPATTKSEASMPSELSSTGTEPKIGISEVESRPILSHSSLQENTDWIKIEPRNLDTESMREGSDALDVDELIASAAKPGGSDIDFSASMEEGKTLTKEISEEGKTSTKDISEEGMKSTKETSVKDVTSTKEISEKDVISTKETLEKDITPTKEISGKDVTSTKEMSEKDITSTKEMSEKDITSTKEMSEKDITSTKEMSGKDITSTKEMSGKDITSTKEMSGKDITSTKEMSEKDIKSTKEMSEKDITSTKEISEKGKTITEEQSIKAESTKNQDSVEEVKSKDKTTKLEVPEEDEVVSGEFKPVLSSEVKSQDETIHKKDVSERNVSTYSIAPASHVSGAHESEVFTEVKKEQSNESEYVLDQSITVSKFVKKRDVNYSVVEIRKGRYGDKSLDKIDSNELMATETVHKLDDESSESSEGPIQERKDTVSIKSEEPEPFWADVPGIGPVIPEAQILAVVEYMQYWASKQQGMVGPRNINHLLCPPLDLPPPPEDADDKSRY